MNTFNLHVIYCGGTIGMQESADGLIPGADLASWLNQLCQTHFPANQLHLQLTEYEPLIDSSNAGPADWQRLVADLKALPSTVDGALILHGTDTLAYSASALAFSLGQLSFPVVLTGSQLPFQAKNSDAPDNVLGAIKSLLACPCPLVGLFFHHRLWSGATVSKTNAVDFDAFCSPNAFALAEISADGQVHFVPRSALPVRNQQIVFDRGQPFRNDLEIATLFLTPGISAQRMNQLLQPTPNGLIVLGFGAGNGPENDPDLPGLIKKLSQSGTVCAILSQCREGIIDSHIYRTGSALLTAGAIGGGSLTVEAAYTKLWFLLSQGFSVEQVKELMTTSLVGELSS